ncbi:MAG: S-methyl-5-thioribose-1-phosphate isomerase, partial [Exiguobacterium undae]
MSQFVQSIIYENGTVTILDQTRLPEEERYEVIHDLAQAIEAIKQLRVRGAPAISLFGGFVLVQEAFRTTGSLDEVKQELLTVSAQLLATRPTAVNLRNVLDELNQLIVSATTLEELPKRLEQKAVALYEADAKTSRQIGVHAM